MYYEMCNSLILAAVLSVSIPHWWDFWLTRTGGVQNNFERLKIEVMTELCLSETTRRRSAQRFHKCDLRLLEIAEWPGSSCASCATRSDREHEAMRLNSKLRVRDNPKQKFYK